MELFRKVIFWCHLVTGVIGGIIVLIMSVTGVLLMYEKQIILWADTRNYRAEPPAGTARLSVETIIAKASESQPDAVPATVTLRSDPTYPATLSYAGGRNLFVNPYTGDIWGEGSKGVRDFFRTMTDWHRWLGAQGENRAVGRAITGACNLGFLFLVISGFYLWWPNKWKWPVVRNVIWFKRGLPGKARDFNWHNVIGFWSVVPLFIVVLSAVVISYVWAGNLVYKIAGEEPPAPRPAAPPGQAQGGQAGQRQAEKISLDGIDSLWSRAEQQVSDWQSINLRLPTAADAPLVFTIDQGSGGQPQKRGTLTLDRATGETRLWEPFSSLTPGRRLRSILRFAHTGEVAGIVGQTIAGIASAGGAVLVWTGIALAWRRFRAWLKRRSGSTVQTVPQMAEEAMDTAVGND